MTFANYCRTGRVLFALPIILLLASISSFAQQTTYRINYNQALLDLPGGLLENPSGNYVFAGTNTSFIPLYGTVTEVNNVGTVVWSKGYTGSIATQINDIKNVPAGGYIATGANDPGLMLLRLDGAGNVDWSYRYRVSGASGEYGNRVLPTSDGGFVVAGYVYDADPDGSGPLVRQDSSNMMCMKVDANGTLLWGNVFFFSTSFIDDHALTDVAEVSDGYIFTGYVNESGNDGPTDAVIIKTNFNGVRQWSYRFGGSNSQTADGIKSTSSTQVVVTGGDNGRPYFLRLNASGSVLGGSRYAFGLFSLNQAFGTDIILTDDGNYAISGTFVGFNLPPVFSSFLFKAAPSNGSLFFDKYYSPTSTSFLSVSLLPRAIQASDTSYMMLSTGFGTTGGYDYELIKADKNGNLNNTDCPEDDMDISRSSYTPGLTSFTPLNITSVSRSSLTVAAINLTPTSNIACRTVVCNGPPPPTSVTASNNNFCPGGSTIINASGSGANVTYIVYGQSTGGTALGNTPYTVSPTTTTTYYVEANDNNNPLCSSTRVAVTVTVLPPPPARPGTISGPNPTCPGNRTYSVAAVAGASTYNWSVSGGGTISGSSTSATVNWTTPGTHTISVTASNSCGTSAVRTLSVTVGDPPPAQPGPITGNTTPCPGSESYTISAVSGASSYNWSVSGGGSITGSGTSATVNWTTSGGPYTISVTATNGCGTSSPRTLTVNVQPGPPTSIGSITGNTNVCVGSQNYSIPTVAGATNYTWSVSGGGSVTGGQGTTNATVNWTSGGTYTVSVTASNSCGNISATPLTVTVASAPPATPGPITGVDTACTGNQTYTIPPVANADSYTWSISGGGTVVSGANSTSFTVNWTTGGTHTISVTATNACGTSSPATYTVLVSPGTPPTPGPISGNTSVCAGSETYSITPVSGATGYSWTVSGGGTITAGQNTNSITVNWTAAGGPYTVSVIPANICGSGSSSNLQVTVLPDNPSSPASISGNSPVCFGAESYTAASVTGASDYTWTVNGGGTITGGQGTGTAEITWATAGTWTVSVTADNQCGSSPATTLTVEVLPASPPTPGAISGNSPVCPGAETYSITSVTGATDYTWSVSGGGSVTGGQNTTAAEVTWTTAGTWTVSVTANSICGSSSPSTYSVTVLPSDPGNAGAISGSTSACPGSETYTITALPDASGYTWTVSGSGTILSGQNTTSITVDWTTSGGPYTVEVTPENACGTGGSSSINVTVLDANPAAPDTIIGPTPVCFGTETYMASSVTGAIGYTWSVNGGGTVVSGQGSSTAGIDWTTAGTWIISVTAENPCGSSTATVDTVEVLPANPATPGNITGPAGVCPGTETYSIPVVPGASGYTWTVSGGGTIASGQGTETIDVDWGAVSGTYTVAVTANNICGSSAQSTISVTVTPGPPTGTPVISGDTDPCPGVETYTVSGVTGAGTYTWTVSGGGTIVSGQGSASIDIDWTTTGGPYTIAVTPENACGTGTSGTLNVTVDGPPDIGTTTISGNNAPCPGSETYTIAAVTNATGYTWTLSGGGAITGGQGTTSVTVNWTTSGGPYTLSVTADNACGSSSAATYSVTVQPGPPAVPGAISGETSVCAGTTAEVYTIGTVTNATGYTWTVSSGGTVTSGQGTTTATIDWSGAAPGNYTVSVTADNPCGSSTASTINVTVTPGAPNQPGAITGPASVCPGTETYTVASVPTASGYNWTISGGGTIASGQGSNSITINWTTSGGPYQVSVVAQNNCGSSTAQTMDVTVQPSPTAPTVTTSGDTICEGETATITATGSTGGAITYNIFDQQTGGTNLGVSPLTVNPTITTTYYVEVVNDLGCRYSGGRVPVTVVVSPAPAAPTITGNTDGVCFGDEATLTASVTGGGNITWWNAATGGTLLGTGNTLNTGELTSTTTFYAEATSANGCASLTGRLPVTVNVSPLPTVTLTTDATNNTIFINQALTAIAEPEEYSQYEFFLNGNQVQIDSINTWASSILEDGDIISVIATDGGCVGEEVEITIIVSDYPNAFTPNGDGRNDVFMASFDLVIINRWGQELYSGMDGWDGTFNGERVSPGTYYYILRVQDITDTETVLKGSVMVHY